MAAAPSNEGKGQPSSSSNGFSIQGMQDSAERLLSENVKGVTDKASAVLDDGLNAASEAVRAGVGAAYAEGAVAAAAARSWLDTGLGAAKAADSQLFGALKGGLEYAARNPEASAAAGVALGAVLLPGPRSFLVRRVVGRFRSDEARLRSAEMRAASLAEKVEGQAKEAQKLAERLALAEEEYARGLSKLRGAASELRSLASRVQSTQRSGKGLALDLREVPSTAALQMRSDVAQTLSTAREQYSSVERMVSRLAKQGL